MIGGPYSTTPRTKPAAGTIGGFTMSLHRISVLVILLSSPILVLRLHAQQWAATDVIRPPKQPTLVRQVVGGGRWQSVSAAGDQRNWGVEVKHYDDDSFTGRVTLVRGPVPQVDIEGQVSGNEVYGALVDKNSMQIGTFTGTISTSGLSGTYTAANGDTGNWTWDGPLPGAQLAPAPLPVPVSQEAAVDPSAAAVDP